MVQSQILDFYENKNVFITGGTGFLGKVLIEKLLRSTNAATLYILIRHNKNHDASTRLERMLNCEASTPHQKYFQNIISLSYSTNYGRNVQTTKDVSSQSLATLPRTISVWHQKTKKSWFRKSTSFFTWLLQYILMKTLKWFMRSTFRGPRDC